MYRANYESLYIMSEKIDSGSNKVYNQPMAEKKFSHVCPDSFNDSPYTDETLHPIILKG